jgi:Flp pilus assembly pilin Flp
MVEKQISKRDGQALRRRRGQGMTEYVIIVALVAIGAIGVITLFGDNIRQVFSASADALAGSTNVTNQGTTTPGNLRRKNLSNFGQNNSAP